MILLLGASGQLGTSIGLELSINKCDFVAVDTHSLDVTNKDKLKSFIIFLKPKIIINASAYTNVNKAEQQKALAKAINVGTIETICEIVSSYFDTYNKPVILHYSTDYVFDGNKNKEYCYKEIDKTNPLNYYGVSKRNGEVVLSENYDKYFTIRTSWLFSEHGKNFVKTISSKLVELNSISPLNIVNDQFGSPTSAKSLAKASMMIIKKIINEKNFVKNT
jgi:dTDP-4-dehydrorhamnose reductase